MNMNHPTTSAGYLIGWLTDESLVERVIELLVSEAGPEYASHSDLMEGRAEKPGKWAPDIEQVLAQEFESLELSDSAFAGPGTRIAVATNGSQLVAFAVVAHVLVDAGPEKQIRFGRIDDIIVRPEFRSAGVGTALMAWVETRLSEGGVTRLFLESGIGNQRAHEFFARCGFNQVSLTMLKHI